MLMVCRPVEKTLNRLLPTDILSITLQPQERAKWPIVQVLVQTVIFNPVFLRNAVPVDFHCNVVAPKLSVSL